MAGTCKAATAGNLIKHGLYQCISAASLWLVTGKPLILLLNIRLRPDPKWKLSISLKTKVKSLLYLSIKIGVRMLQCIYLFVFNKLFTFLKRLWLCMINRLSNWVSRAELGKDSIWFHISFVIHDHHSLAELHTAALTVYTLFQCFLILWNWILPFSEMPHMHRVSFDVTLLCRSFIQRMAILDTERSSFFSD